MTAALIRALIDVCTIGDPELNDGCIDLLLNDDLIRPGSHGYQATDRGKKMFELLTEVPLPVQVLADPRRMMQ